MKDPYQSLGLSKSATQDEIKNAYRKLAKKFHPDLNPGNKQAEAKFKEISSAYDAIETPEKREKFDRGETMEQEQERARQYASRGGPSSYYNTQQDGGRYSYNFGDDESGGDIFENLFGRGGRQSRRRAPEDYPGEDHLYRMEVEFKDSVLGAEREITLPTGKKLQVKIPAGVESGTKLRLKGLGDPGIGKGRPGDALVEIHVKDQSGFKRVGQDIEVELPLSFIEALVGAEVPVPTVEGAVMLKVPQGVSTGSKLRIRGKGIGSPSKERGDQIAVIKIVMPKVVDSELQASVKAWGDKFSYNPRNPS